MKLHKRSVVLGLALLLWSVEHAPFRRSFGRLYETENHSIFYPPYNSTLQTELLLCYWFLILTVTLAFNWWLNQPKRFFLLATLKGNWVWMKRQVNWFGTGLPGAQTGIAAGKNRAGLTVIEFLELWALKMKRNRRKIVATMGAALLMVGLPFLLLRFVASDANSREIVAKEPQVSSLFEDLIPKK